MASDSDHIRFSDSARAALRQRLSFAAAFVFHALVFWGLASSISFRTTMPAEEASEPRLVALAPRSDPPPPDVEQSGLVDAISVLPRFRPRLAAPSRQRREGDPALAIWTYLCNRDGSLSEAVQRDCPEFHFGDVMLSMNEPLNRQGDIGALLGPDTATMSIEEAGKAKGWQKPKTPWPAEGARARANSLGLPGRDPFAILPK